MLSVKIYFSSHFIISYIRVLYWQDLQSKSAINQVILRVILRFEQYMDTSKKN